MPKQPSGANSEEARKVGARIANVRKSRGLSQAAVGEILGVTFQQIQKYENGRNAISLDRLRLFCEAMQVDLLAILPGVNEGHENRFSDWLDKPGAVEMLEAYSAITSPDTRKMALDVVKTMSSRDKP